MPLSIRIPVELSGDLRVRKKLKPASGQDTHQNNMKLLLVIIVVIITLKILFHILDQDDYRDDSDKYR